MSMHIIIAKLLDCLADNFISDLNQYFDYIYIRVYIFIDTVIYIYSIITCIFGYMTYNVYIHGKDKYIHIYTSYMHT